MNFRSSCCFHSFRCFLLAAASNMPGNSSSSPWTGLTARRRKIAKACDFCREHRVRCEAVTPCPHCVANNLACRRSRSSLTSKRITPAKNGDRDRRLAIGPSVDVTRVNDSQPVNAPVPTPSENLAWTSHKTDSTLGFIARIDVFCSGLPQTSPSFGISGSDIPLDLISSWPTSLPHDINGAACDLSPGQTNHLLRLFWSHIRPQMPIVEWKDLRSASEHTNGASSPLQDAITAYSLRYIYYTGLHKRIVGFSWSQFKQPTIPIGMSYFQRCLSAVTQFATFAGPSISVMQCYCYLTLYLLDAEHHQAAYNMVGVGLRIAESLNYMDSRNGGYRECQLFRRIWWTLIHLDFRCSRHVGKPVSIRVDDLLCLRPTKESEDFRLSNGLLYHTESIRLTAAALVINESMDRDSLLGKDSGPAHVEERAKALSRHLHHLQRWREELPREQHFADLHFDVCVESPDPRAKLDAQEECMEQSPMVTTLNTLLLIQYHNVMISLHRVFIQFPSHPPVPKSNPTADTHAATALHHASTMIKIAYHRMAAHDIFHGVSEFYQYQWNAVITIIGFMLAYPYCHRCPAAREALVLALEIFDSAGSKNSTATRAAALTRHLCNKFDALVQRLSIPQPSSGVLSSLAAIPETQPAQDQSGDTMNPGIQGEGSLLPDPNEDSLWPWADLIDFDAWSTYCDEVSGTFMDLTDFSER